MPVGSLLRRRPWISALLLGFQLLVAVAVPLADGRVEAVAVQLPTHIEAPGEGSHPPGHDHFRCQLCRATGASLLASHAAVHVYGLGAEHSDPTPHAREARTRVALSGPFGPRAPPSA